MSSNADPAAPSRPPSPIYTAPPDHRGRRIRRPAVGRCRRPDRRMAPPQAASRWGRPHAARPRPRRRPHRHLLRDRPRIDRCRIRLARSDRPGRGRSTTRQPVAILGAISQLCRDHPPQTATPTQSRNLAIPHRRRSAQSRCQSRQSRDLSNLALPLLRGRSCPRTKSTHSSAWTAAGGSTPSATKSTARPRHDHRTDLAATPLLRPSGGTVLADSTRATRAAPPGETVVYPGTVTTNS
jgi:hypothetical protein